MMLSVSSSTVWIQGTYVPPNRRKKTGLLSVELEGAVDGLVMGLEELAEELAPLSSIIEAIQSAACDLDRAGKAITFSLEHTHGPSSSERSAVAPEYQMILRETNK
ncbi:hypothetical protein CSKR_201912 [Clonorchis sinensis]|uniref:Uncharacterized protein n=1 Tax=Clonorchis sinensis TaxID=79923 RepID=A0A8T1MY66_CLOSI|nr:hypothetical protein CSKR_201912 [Clonorchis sinensis]